MTINRKLFIKPKINVHLTPGETLKLLRELQEMTQAELADATGMPQSNISALERGTSQIGRDRALQLAKALKVHPAVILFPDFDMREIA